MGPVLQKEILLLLAVVAVAVFVVVVVAAATTTTLLPTYAASAASEFQGAQGEPQMHSSHHMRGLGFLHDFGVDFFWHFLLIGLL